LDSRFACHLPPVTRHGRQSIAAAGLVALRGVSAAAST
jgi:hypothetical protein